MKCTYSCHSPEHAMARRRVSGRDGRDGGRGDGRRPRLLHAARWRPRSSRTTRSGSSLFNMHGGLSQLESWDPKPGTDTGGPFRAISTSVPGIQISELLPNVARQMHHLCLVRGVNTSEDDHGKGAYLMTTGRRQTPGRRVPEVRGRAAPRRWRPRKASLPGHILITPGGGGGRGNDSAYLGPKYSSIYLGNGNAPQYTTRPGQVSEPMDSARNDFRRRVNDRFLSRRRTAVTEAYTYSYEQAIQLMRQRDVFDVTKEPAKDHERYGKYDLGRHCLLARRLLEKGATFVQVSHSNYDTHNENFNFHIEQLGEFDRSFAAFVADLADRGMLDSTLIVVLSEFGRTPNINLYYGRDHWSHAWTVVMAGGKVHRGVAYGKTNAKGTEVVDGQVDHANLFHTYLQAVGVDSTDSFDIEGRDVPIADPASKMIRQILS